jgi:general secretion pathway protein G
MIELLVTVAIIGTLSSIGVPLYTNYMDRMKNSTAVTEIREIELGIVKFQTERGRPPDTLAEAGIPTKLDPWGHPYEYLRLEFEGVDPKTIVGHRKDRSNNPLNADFDLYSMGKDGKTVAELASPRAYDDIVRANSGAYIGLASEY